MAAEALMMIEPLHIATVGGHPLRFFRTPLNDGRPDFPWLAIDDLYRCLGFNRPQRKRLQQKARIGARRTIATAKGSVSIAPHAIARAAVEARVEMGRAPASVRDDYVHASAEALMKLAPQPFPSAEALTAWVNEAANRWRLHPEPISIAELFPFIEKHGGRDD
jgi:hypothetical protein